MFLLDNKPLQVGVPFTHNEFKYPANWLQLASLEEKEAIGITEVADEPIVDDRFYWNANNPKDLEDRLEVKEDGSPLFVQVYDQATKTMVDTAEQVVTKGLKSQWIAQIKDTTNKLLASTDWMVIRKIERNIAIPANVIAYRKAVIDECVRLESEITSKKKIDKFIEVVTNQNFPMIE